MDEMNDKMKDCKKACLHCYKMCTKTARYCLERGGEHASVEHMTLLQDCAKICALSVDFMMRRSDFASAICDLCADICERCAESCEGFDNEEMEKCASMCRECAKKCREMVSDTEADENERAGQSYDL